jgi:hypothetical protein
VTGPVDLPISNPSKGIQLHLDVLGLFCCSC